MSDAPTLDHEPRGSPVDDDVSVAPPRSRPHRRRTPLPSLIARAVLGALVVVACVASVWWWASGGKWFMVRTPSMGRAAPVGTLLWVKPTNIDDVHVGDLVTIHTPEFVDQGAGVHSPPIRVPQRTYTHRVVGRFADGTLQTKGDLNVGPDPWHTDQQHLIGQVTASWRGAGWLGKALPLLIFGGIGWWVITGLLASKRSRAPLRVIGAAILVAGAIYLFNPLFGASQLYFAPLGPQAARATYVGTGLMPIRLLGDGAPTQRVVLGERQSVMTKVDRHGRFQVKVMPTVPWQTWAIVAGASLAPAVWSVIVGVDASPPPPRRRPRRRGRPPMAPEARLS